MARYEFRRVFMLLVMMGFRRALFCFVVRFVFTVTLFYGAITAVGSTKRTGLPYSSVPEMTLRTANLAAADDGDDFELVVGLKLSSWP